MNKTFLPALVSTVLACGAATAAPRSGPSAIATSTATPTAQAPARGWVTVAENPRGEMSIKADSFTLGEDASRAPVVMATVRMLDRTTQEILVKEAVVGLGDCQSGAGTLYLANLSDLGLFSHWEFAFGAGNIASSAAEALCSVAARGIADAMQAQAQVPAPEQPARVRARPRQPDPNEI